MPYTYNHICFNPLPNTPLESPVPRVPKVWIKNDLQEQVQVFFFSKSKGEPEPLFSLTFSLNPGETHVFMLSHMSEEVGYEETLEIVTQTQICSLTPALPFSSERNPILTSTIQNCIPKPF